MRIQIFSVINIYALILGTCIFKVDTVELSTCTQHWVQTLDKGYGFKVDCSNRGFAEIPVGLPTVTSDLKLNGNSISSVDHIAFAGLTSLHSIDLSGNDIVYLDETVFRDTSKLTSLDLGDNKLSCDWRIWWLVSFSKKLENFTGNCFNPRALRGKNIKSLSEEELAVDCQSVKKLTGASDDGEYEMRVFGNDNSITKVFIYCHKMASDNPSEFLMLPSGEERNYVSVEADELCNYDSEFREIIEDMNTTVRFSFIKIDLMKLWLIANDTTMNPLSQLSFGKPTICNDDVCLNGVANVDLRGTHFRLQGRKSTTKKYTCNTKCGECSYPNYLALDLVNAEKHPYSACTTPLGMQSKEIPDTAITASSNAGKFFHPRLARVNSIEHSGWCAGLKNTRQYLLVDLGKEMTISGISTQGHKKIQDWVTTYKLLYSSDGTYVEYKHVSGSMIFTGNIDRHSVVTHWLRPRITARYLKVQPLSWHDQEDFDRKICMRVEFYGCVSDINSYIIQPSNEQSCLTVSNKWNLVDGYKQYAMVKKLGCQGPDFMFTFHNRKITHTKTGLCLHMNGQSGLVLNSTCSPPKDMMFQKVAASGEAFLMKDHNGKCARLFDTEVAKSLHGIWRGCNDGGFTIFQLKRQGVSAFQPLFDEKEVTITTDLFVPLNLTCKARAEPLPIYEWSRGESIHENRAAVIPNENVTSIHGYTTLSIHNVTWNERGVYVCNVWNSKGYNFKKYNVDVNPIQSFVKTPQNVDILYGGNARFECQSKGIPEPSVEWMIYDNNDQFYRNVLDIDRNKYQIIENGTLSIQEVNYDDEIVYYCVSTNGKLVRNVSASLEVYVTQSFTVKPTPQTVLYGKDIVFNCISEGQPKPTVSWLVDLDHVDNLITIDDSLNSRYRILQNGNLLVKNAKLEENGRYFCVSDSPGWRVNVSATLEVYVTQSFRIEPQSSRVLHGTNYTVLCESVGMPTPNISWLFKPSFSNTTTTTNVLKLTERTNNKAIQRSDGHLLITNAGFEESGEYICVSHSPGLIRNISGVIDVYVTQNFTQRPESQTVIQNHYMVAFSCISSGTPTPRMSWRYQKRGSNTILRVEEFEDERHQIMPNNDFVIRNVRKEDEGTYICVSVSPRLTVNTTAQLTVNVPPTAILENGDITKYAGESLNITCGGHGDPQPNIKFFKMNGTNKSEIGTKTGDRVYFEDGVLYINEIEKNDGGDYVCDVSNVAGVDSKTITIRVKVRCLLNVDDSTHSPEQRVFAGGESAEVTCLTGFKLKGVPRLLCQESGKFDQDIPTCEDIDECKENTDVSVCDLNSECRNMIGSYECVIIPNIVTPKTTVSRKPTSPKKQDYSWLYKSIHDFKTNQISENDYLEKLLQFTQNISALPHATWREAALSKIANKALNMIYPSSRERRSNDVSVVKKNIKLFATIVSTTLDEEFIEEWKNVNEDSCGTVCLMKNLESYLQAKSPKLMLGAGDGVVDIKLKNLAIQLMFVDKHFKTTQLQISLGNPDTQNNNTIKLPSGNYPLLKGSTSFGILYKTLHKVFPSSELLSEIFSVSFTSLEDSEKLLQPAQIIFKFREELSESSDDIICSFWNFSKSAHGAWSNQGCEKLNTSSSTEVVCQCDHLTNFAIIVPKTSVNMIYLTFSLAVAVCVGFCIMLAFLTCMSHVCCSQYVKSDRQTILVNVTLTIVLGLIVFGGGVFLSAMKFVPEKYSTYFCFSLVGTLQLFGCAFFAWMFAEAIHLHFSSRIVINKGNGRLTLFYFIGWGLPICIVAGTGVLVYFDKFELQSRCMLNISLYLVSILIGAPCLLFILATFIVYVMIRVNMASDRELLNGKIITHTKGAMLCSFCLILLHVLVLGSATMFLRFNTESLYHYILAGLTALEGIYLVFYHCYIDRRAGRSNSRQGSKKRNSYSTKETITYSPNGTSSNPEIAEEANEQKYLIKRSSKRLSKGEQTKSPTPPHIQSLHSSDEAIEWDASYQGMYGASLANTNQSAQGGETKPLLSGYHPDGNVNEAVATPSTFRRDGSFSKNSTLSRNGTFPRRWNDSQDGMDDVPTNRPPLKRSTSKASSILSIETHTSSNAQNAIPVYFPAPPPHYEMSLDRNKPHGMHNIDTYLESADTSRPTSFGMESDRVSNLSSELSNILYELQAFDTNRPPAETRSIPVDYGSQTLPLRREPPITDISHNSTSTFKPSTKHYSKNDVQFGETKPPSYSDHNRVRILRGKSRQEADPADNGSSHSGSMYSSL